MVLRLDIASADFAASFAALVARRREAVEEVDRDVAAIIAEVRAEGDAALLRLTERWDGLRLGGTTPLRVTDAEIAAARAACDPATLDAIELAATRIDDHHRRQLPAALDYVDASGVRLGQRWTAIEAVGIYVPGGTASYPSSVLMNAIPARVAGVDRIAMVVPAPGGRLTPLVLAAASRAGVTEIYRVGGAQAIAALAYGTETIAAVDKIVGPGNAYVAAAKRQVFGVVGIDLIAGPSEILVVADAASDPRHIAADLMSQAEHDPAAQAVFMTDDANFADRVVTEVDALLARLPRAAIACASWAANGAIIVVGRLADTAPLIDRLAPEHLALAVADPDALAARVRHAGAIFLGRMTPEAIGDYVAGPNHVLPTSRSARFASGLSVLDFLKRTSLVACDARAIAAIGPAAETLARAEGLEAHARSVALRLRVLED